MNKNLNDAMSNIGKADALMYAIECCYLDFDFSEEEAERMNRGMHAFYALWDAIKATQKNLDLLAGDERVVDVAQAIRNSRE